MTDDIPTTFDDEPVDEGDADSPKNDPIPENDPVIEGDTKPGETDA